MNLSPRTTRNTRNRRPLQKDEGPLRTQRRAKQLSRLDAAGGYAQIRSQRSRRKTVVKALGITLASLLVVAIIGVAAFALVVNNKLGTDFTGNKGDFDSGTFKTTLVAPEKPEDPFWMLLMGTDDREDLELPRTDTLILVRVDQANKAMAMISIPRDTYVEIEGIGGEKINTAYTYAEIEKPGSGTAATLKAVSRFSGVDISYFAQVNFDGLIRLVDGLNGVEVDVPVDIIGDYDAGGLDIYAGQQTLDGAHALVFCRSREFLNGDYQRQANQRTFLQALATKVLASNPATIATTVTNLADMTYTNMDIAKIVKVAQGMAGMKENGIHTYTVPSTTDDTTGTSYVVADADAWTQLLRSIEAGSYPERQDEGIGGVVPESYVAGPGGTATDGSTQAPLGNPGDYTVEVRNGNGITGSAKDVSDAIASAGYVPGEVGDAQNSDYATTLIVYKNDGDKRVADDIRQRLGYGKPTASRGAYTFSGDILVVVGKDFKA
ncbi:MAG: LCP family protein [Coriobacteriales bacterium]|jgi:LCP family protein required for cell wall assembly|nr:LCP family protein [Coriobacteriales bacterium]